LDRLRAKASHWQHYSGVSPNIAFSLFKEYGSVDCLQRISPEQLQLIRELKQEIGGEKLIEFVPLAFAERCKEVLESLRITELTFDNVWVVFEDLLPLVFEEEV